LLLVIDSRHPAAAVGTPICARGPNARSAGDKRYHREGRLQVGFGRIYAVFIGQIYAVFLAEIYALWVFLENTAYNTGRIFWADNTGRIFFIIRAVWFARGGSP
jgi:hypothetical protein